VTRGQRWLFSLMITAVVCGIVFYFFWQHMMSVGDSMVENPPQSMLVRVEANPLSGEYAVDRKAANKKYNGKVVELTGTVTAVGDGVLMLEGVYPIRVEMQKKISLADVRQGQQITLRAMPLGLNTRTKELLLAKAVIVSDASK